MGNENEIGIWESRIKDTLAMHSHGEENYKRTNSIQFLYVRVFGL